MADIASLGLAVDLSEVDAASRSLGNFSQSGKAAQISTDVLVASAVRLGISVEEVERRLAAANDNLTANTEQSIKLSDATRLVAASNDNFSKSMVASNAETANAGRGFFGTIEAALSLAGHLKLLAIAAYALIPPFRGFVNAGIGKVLLEIIPASAIAQKALAGLSSAGSALLSFLGMIGPPVLAVAIGFEILSAIWNKGAALLDKYANSLRKLDLEGTAESLTKLTKNQGEPGEIISAAQIARATELGVRLQDASFTINQFLTRSVINLTSASLALQDVWVNFVEIIAKGAAFLSALPIDKLLKVAAFVAAPTMVSGRMIASALKPESNFDTDSVSLQSATSRLSAIMGVANLAKEGLQKTQGAVDDLSKEFNIGSSFIARYSDSIKKLVDGVKDTDSFDRVARSIDKMTTRIDANANSIGQSVKFQESLRVETQLLASTAGGLNEVTDKQLEKFVELRTEGVEPFNAMMQAGIDIGERYTKTFLKLSEVAGTAKDDFAKANFALSNIKANDSNEIALRSLTAYSAAQKGAIAADQKRLELRAELVRLGNTKEAQEQVEKQAQNARNLAMATEIKQLNEIKRSRELSANQAVDSAKLETEMFGKTIGQQEELRANLQTRQALEQQASQNRSKFDDAEYEKLKKINKELGEQKQLNAIAAMNDNIKFGRNTSLLSPEDVAIAQQLKGIMPDVAEALNSTQAAAMRVNSAMSNISSTISNNMTSAIVDVMNNTKSAGEAFKSFGLVVVKALEEAIVKLMIVGPLMRSLQSGLGGNGADSLLGSIFGGGGSAVGTAGSSFFGPIAPSMNGNVFAGGNIIPFAKGGILGGPTMAPMALMSEAGPEAVMPLSRGSNGKLGIASNGGGQQRVKVDVGISIDENVNLQAYIKNVSQDEASRTVNATLDHPSFQQRVANAGSKARSRNLR